MERLGSSARMVAGGHSLLPMMKLRLANFEYLIDINDLHDELGYIRVEPTPDPGRCADPPPRAARVATSSARAFPIFHDAERVIADPVVRNRGTIGGSLCQADPSEDLSAVCTTLDASCVIRGSGGERVVTMEDFHRGPYETAVGDGEILIEVRLPDQAERLERLREGRAPSRRLGGRLVRRRRLDERTVSSPTRASVWRPSARTPPASRRSPQALRGHAPSEELYAQAGAIAAENCTPSTDMRGSVEYKRHLAE